MNARVFSSINRHVILATAFLIFSGTLLASGREPASAKHGMVVSAESLATRAGVEVLKNGGNAIDAAVAVGFTLAVTFPEAGNIGGGGFMLIRLADGTSTMIDFREKAPAKASQNMFLDTEGRIIPGKSERGPLSAGVPGTVAGYLHALEKYGTCSRQTVLAPAIKTAVDGFPISRRIAESLKESMNDFSVYPSTISAFTKRGIPYEEGEIFLQPDLANTLRNISAFGKDGFYAGYIAELIVAEMARHGGIITLHDLLNYETVEREPLRSLYRDHEIITASPPSAGGVVLIQMLNMLERFNLASKGHNSPETIHLFAAAAQRAYADRSKFLGDPDFVNMPVAQLISKQYARMRSELIDTLRAVASAAILPATGEEWGQSHTTHYCVADSFGNMVSVTTTLNGLFGCKTVVGGAGFFLNNEMDDFSMKPGVPNMYGLVHSEANAIAPMKRMLSSMTPTIVLKDGKPFFTVGGRGGSRITTAVANIILNVIDFGMNIQDAVESPRIHHQWLPDTIFYETNGLSPVVIESLQKMGYALEQTKTFNARAHAILIDPVTRMFLGGADPREEGVAIGY